MTNESLKKLLKIADYLEKSSAPDIADEIKKCVSNIKLDLEILEILKKYLVIAINQNDESEWLTFDRQVYNDDIDTEKDFYKIKEWLEND